MARGSEVESPFTIGLREALEAGIVVGVAAASVPRPWESPSVRTFWATLALGAVLSGVASWALYESAAPVAARQAEIWVAFCVLAAVTLTATAVWVARRAHPALGLRPAVSASTAAAIGALALVRETAEATWFVLADSPGEASSSVGGLLLGAAVGTALVAGAFGLLFVTARERTIYVVSETMLVLVAGGMLVSATRAVHDAGWSALGSQPLVELGFLQARSARAARFTLGIIGVHPEVTVAEGATWLAYGAAVALVGWQLSSASLRLKARRALR